MNMTPVISDNVAFVGYNYSTLVLRVIFRSGGTYDYSGIPANLYEAMLRPHPWRRVGRQIRAHRGHRVAA